MSGWPLPLQLLSLLLLLLILHNHHHDAISNFGCCLWTIARSLSGQKLCTSAGGISLLTYFQKMKSWSCNYYLWVFGNRSFRQEIYLQSPCFVKVPTNYLNEQKRWRATKGLASDVPVLPSSHAPRLAWEYISGMGIELLSSVKSLHSATI